MPGFQNSRANNFLLLIILMCTAVLAGCSGSNVSEKEKSTSPTLDSFIAQHEKSFDPTRYEPSVERIKQEDRRQSNDHVPDIAPVTVAPETLPGFRVQVLFTQDIDEANALRDSLSSMFADQWIYTVFEPPYYKVRVGNFLERPAANKMVNTLMQKGFTGAWVVPDQVIKNPPQKQLPAPPQNEPEHQEEQH